MFLFCYKLPMDMCEQLKCCIKLKSVHQECWLSENSSYIDIKSGKQGCQKWGPSPFHCK